MLFLEGFKQVSHFSHLRGHNQALGLELMRQLNILLSLQFQVLCLTLGLPLNFFNHGFVELYESCFKLV
jgi:hypothetical protein